MRHLLRAAALLGMLALGLALFRSPPSITLLARSGFYQEGSQASNARQWAALTPGHQGAASCQECHPREFAAWQKSEHSTVNCDSCHGPTAAHMESGAKLVADTSREFCGLCHARLPSRPSAFPQVDLAEHGGERLCVTCHDPRAPRLGPSIPHPLEGRASCSSCHLPGVKEPLKIPDNHRGRSDATCTRCHETR